MDTVLAIFATKIVEYGIAGMSLAGFVGLLAYIAHKCQADSKARDELHRADLTLHVDSYNENTKAINNMAAVISKQTEQLIIIRERLRD